nr:dol-P-Man:Man(7)GlcNAc(2)-PP-Dol alpha-1,6-mannosyltransferase [Tanacetum cinerariifolium]
MTAVSKTKNMMDYVRDGSFKWLNKNVNSYNDEFDEMKSLPAGAEDKNWIRELSVVANVVVRRCAKILDISAEQLRDNFEKEASEATKHPSRYARNILEYSCFRALAQSTQVNGYMEDKRFRRLTFDMMIGWEVPDAASQPSVDIDEDASVGLEAFSRIAPAVPIIANVIVSNYIYEFLTASTRGRLQFSAYDKYLTGLERAIKRIKSQSESSLLQSQRSARGERVLELDGTVTTQPVLQHLGISTWPGRLTLTDHALYFEALKVVSYDTPTVYELAADLKQVVKAELTGPWGTRLFDKAVLYKSSTLSEPVIMELPELKGHARRDYWLAIVREILYAHRFIRKFQLTGVARDEALLKAIFGILRIQALNQMSSTLPLCYETGLMYNACDQLPGGDRILEAIATMLTSKEPERNKSSCGMYSVSAASAASGLGFVLGTSSNMANQSSITVGEITVGEMTPLEKAVDESRSNYKMVADAQATVDGAKVEGLDTNLAVLKTTSFPSLMDFYTMSSSGQDYSTVDELLDFSNDDSNTFSPSSNDVILHQHHHNMTSSSSATNTTNNTFNFNYINNENNNYDFATAYNHSSNFTDNLCVPSDDVAELEWLSNFVHDSFSNFPANNVAGTINYRPENTSFHSRSRTKRTRAPTHNTTATTWTSSSTTPVKIESYSSPTSSSSDNTTEGGIVRRCTHCSSEKTPQWRTGPLGPKTLCNACGVRYKSGRLVPEYRPAASPTFVLTQHSNSHRKVMELRRQKEMMIGQPQQSTGSEYHQLYGNGHQSYHHHNHNHNRNNYEQEVDGWLWLFFDCSWLYLATGKPRKKTSFVDPKL